jgi:thiamine-phosphate pyrophosphorylase
MSDSVFNRCRLVLIVPEDHSGPEFISRLEQALAGGDVASVIIPGYDLDEAGYQKHLETCIPIVQAAGAAAVAVNDSRAFGRTGADGLHVDTNRQDLAEAIEKFHAKGIIGAGGAESRHKALDFGELRPDYMFFGRIGHDTHAAPHKKNVELAEWWSGMIEIPCILMGGASLETLDDAAASGAEFVALSHAVFDAPDCGAAVAQANAILEQHGFSDGA